MDIDGTYTVDVEMTARKRVHRGEGRPRELVNIDPATESNEQKKQVEQVVNALQEDPEMFDDLVLQIDDNSLTVRGGDSDWAYEIQRKVQKEDAEWELNLYNERKGPSTWVVTRAEDYLFIQCREPVSEYVFRAR